eukprot:TRINITY_DN3142_c0_g2_i1.p1 TRINITY_DN3142_c0_g2~~TRINITY_DN3142_c0_g2_i1.p1  ORF type:complete len:271 (+),score=45.62 TRINITY_DN3142_c0_g2_i1:41-814(+)
MQSNRGLVAIALCLQAAVTTKISTQKVQKSSYAENCSMWLDDLQKTSRPSSNYTACDSGFTYADHQCPEDGSGCSRATCCEKLEKCDALNMSIPDFCDNGMAIDPTRDCPGSDKASCSKDVCCVNKITCGDAKMANDFSVQCSDGQTFLDDVQCTGATFGTCTWETCCQNLESCKDFNATKCDLGTSKVGTRMCSGTTDEDCTKEDCCVVLTAEEAPKLQNELQNDEEEKDDDEETDQAEVQEGSGSGSGSGSVSPY